MAGDLATITPEIAPWWPNREFGVARRPAPRGALARKSPPLWRARS